MLLTLQQMVDCNKWIPLDEIEDLRVPALIKNRKMYGIGIVFKTVKEELYTLKSFSTHTKRKFGLTHYMTIKINEEELNF